LNLSNFKTVADVGLKLLHHGHLEWHYLCTIYHDDLPRGSKVIGGGQTDRQTDDFISYFHFWKTG
jgi:hypothetical protein